MTRDELNNQLQEFCKKQMKKNRELQKENGALKDDIAFLKRVICGILMRNGERIALTRDILEMPEPDEESFDFEENMDGEPILIVRKARVK